MTQNSIVKEKALVRGLLRDYESSDGPSFQALVTTATTFYLICTKPTPTIQHWQVLRLPVLINGIMLLLLIFISQSKSHIYRVLYRVSGKTYLECQNQGLWTLFAFPLRSKPNVYILTDTQYLVLSWNDNISTLFLSVEQLVADLGGHGAVGVLPAQHLAVDVALLQLQERGPSQDRLRHLLPRHGHRDIRVTALGSWQHYIDVVVIVLTFLLTYLRLSLFG